MQLSYTEGMKSRLMLEVIAQSMRELPTVRAVAVAHARAEGMTWREIANILGMTQHGLIKAQRSYEARGNQPGTNQLGTDQLSTD